MELVVYNFSDTNIVLFLSLSLSFSLSTDQKN